MDRKVTVRLKLRVVKPFISRIPQNIDPNIFRRDQISFTTAAKVVCGDENATIILGVRSVSLPPLIRTMTVRVTCMTSITAGHAAKMIYVNESGPSAFHVETFWISGQAIRLGR